MNQLPQQINSEFYVLGVAMMFPGESNGFTELPPEAYHDPRNAMTAKAILTLQSKSLPVDVTTVKNELRRTKQDIDYTHLIDCCNTVGSPSNFEYHLNLVKQAYYGRQMVQRMDTARNAILSGGDIPNQIEVLETLFVQMRQGMNPKEQKDMQTIILEYLDKREMIIANPGKLLGITTGLPDLDRATSGNQDEELIIIAARPGMGKTDLAIEQAFSGSLAGSKTGFISFEMNHYNIVNRLVAKIASVEKRRTIEPELTTEVTNATDKILKSGIQLVNAGSADLPRLKTICKKLISDGCKQLVIDYLQLISTRNQNKNLEVEEITRSLKMDIATEFGIPVVLLSQLNRKVEERSDKRPMLSDLRHSGGIEQDADKVIFLYRPEYYDKDDDEKGPTKNRLELIIAKNRENETGIIDSGYNPAIGKFYHIKQEVAPF